MVDLQKKIEKQPTIETSIRKSEDGKWVIHKTTLTDIKSVNYYGKVLEPAES